MAGSAFLAILAALFQALFNVSFRAKGSGCPVSLNMFIIAESGERKSSTIEPFLRLISPILRAAGDARCNMIVQDVTVDGMVVGLIERCPAQFLLALEAASLLGGHAMNKDNLGRFAGNLASLYSGEPLTRTRVAGHIHAEDRRTSTLLFAQPVVSLGFLSSPIVMDQGLGNRFLFSWPESMQGRRLHCDVELEDDPAFQQLAARLVEIAAMPWDIDPETGGVSTRTVRMSAGAKVEWVMLYNAIEEELSPGGDFASHAGYAGRFSEQVMRIAALLALLDDPLVEEIPEETMRRAITLGDFYLDSALDIFKKAPANQDELQANALLDWMRNKSLELDLPAIPVRMIYKDGPRSARPSKRTKELLATLEARGDVVKFEKGVVYGDGKRSQDNYRVASV
jgi:hypothetical protein